jgi:hypothetical protein
MELDGSCGIFEDCSKALEGVASETPSAPKDGDSAGRGSEEAGRGTGDDAFAPPDGFGFESTKVVSRN